MPVDVFDPGVDGTYPYFPRRLDGTPFWSDSPASDREVIVYYHPDRPEKPIPVQAIPRGKRIRRWGRRVRRIGAPLKFTAVFDVTPRTMDGKPIEPAPIPGWRPWRRPVVIDDELELGRLG